MDRATTPRPDMHRCETCISWEAPHEGGPNATHGFCLLSYERSIGMADALTGHAPPFFGYDDTEAKGVIPVYTAADFGCIYHRLWRPCDICDGSGFVTYPDGGSYEETNCTCEHGRVPVTAADQGV